MERTDNELGVRLQLDERRGTVQRFSAVKMNLADKHFIIVGSMS